MWQLIIFLSILTPLWAWLNVWLIRSFQEVGAGDPYVKQWHFWQFVLRAFVVAYVITFGWQTLAWWKLGLLWWAYDYILYSGIINPFAFRKWEKRGFFYVGLPGREDKHPDLLQGWLMRRGRPEVWNAGLKGVFLVVAAVVYFWK